MTARPIRQKLLSGTATLTAIVAIQLAAPARAALDPTHSLQGTPTYNGAQIDYVPGATLDTINVLAPTAIINWTPFDPASNPIDFVPAGREAKFQGTSDFAVLNRVTGTAGHPLQFNGSVTSNINGTTGGTVMFYSADGFIIAPTGTFNVGSLVLTTGDITDPAFTASSFKTGTPNVGATITNNGSITASNYVVLASPKIVQNGTVTGTTTAYVAAGATSFTFSTGVFDILVDNAIDGAQITHTAAANTVLTAIPTCCNRSYFVAVPKNDAMALLLTGNIGYASATDVQTHSGMIVLSAGRSVADTMLSPPPLTVADAGKASIELTNATINGILDARSEGDATIQSTGNGLLTLTGGGTITSENGTAALLADAGDITVPGNLTVTSHGPTGIARVSITNGHTIEVQGGLSVEAIDDRLTGATHGGNASITVNGGSLLAGAFGADASAHSRGNDASNSTGGTAIISLTNATVVASDISVTSNGQGANAPSAGGQGGTGQGGTATFETHPTTSLSVTNSLSVAAAGQGGGGSPDNAEGDASGIGGTGIGGTATISLDSGAASNLILTGLGASAVGGGGNGQGPCLGCLHQDGQNGGLGQGGSAGITLVSGTVSVQNLSVVTLAQGGNGNNGNGRLILGVPTMIDAGDAGDAIGGTSTLTVSGGSLTAVNTLSLNAQAQGGKGGDSLDTFDFTDPSNPVPVPGGVGGNAGSNTAGTTTISVTGGTLVSNVEVDLDVRASGGLGAGSGNAVNGQGGLVKGGTASITASGTGSINVMGFRLRADGAGGFIGAPGDDGQGGTISLTADGGQITSGYIDLSANGTGGRSRNFTANGSGIGGSVTISAINGGKLVTGDLSATADGFGDGQPGNSDLGGDFLGGAGVGGQTHLVLDGAGSQLTVNSGLFLSAGGFGAYGQGTGGTGDNSAAVAELTISNGAQLIYNGAGSIVISASAFGGNTNEPTAAIVDPTSVAGSAIGGTARLTVDNATLTAPVQIVLDAGAFAGDGLAQGGNATGGTAVVQVINGGTLNATQGLVIDTSATAGGGDLGGIATGGTATLNTLGGSTTNVTGDLGLLSTATGPGETHGGGADATVTNGALNVTGMTTVDASALSTGNLAGDAIGGTVGINLTNAQLIAGDLIMKADATGGNAPDTGGVAGIGEAGAVNFETHPTTTVTLNTITMSASGQGGAGTPSDSSLTPDEGDPSGKGGAGIGGTITISLDSGAGSTFDVASLSATASGGGGNGRGFCLHCMQFDGQDAGDGQGGTLSFTVASGSVGSTTTTLSLDSGSLGGFATGGFGATTIDGGDAGAATAGSSSLTVTGGTLTLASINLTSKAVGGVAGDSLDHDDVTDPMNPIKIHGGVGGAAGLTTAGTATISVTGGKLVSAGTIIVDAGADAGRAGFGDGIGGAGTVGQAGTASITASGTGSIQANELFANADGKGAQGSPGGDGQGGTASITADGGSINAVNIGASASGQGGIAARTIDQNGAGRGGTATISVINSGTMTADSLSSGTNGSGQGEPGDADKSGSFLGGSAFGGEARIIVDGAGSTLNVTGEIGVSSTGFAGFGESAGGNGDNSAAVASLELSNEATLNYTGNQDIILDASASGGGTVDGQDPIQLDDSIAGNAIGGTAQLLVGNTTLLVPDGVNVLLDAHASGGDGLGTGGTATGGTALLRVGPGGNFRTSGDVTLDSSALAGGGGMNGNGGGGIGGTATLDAVAGTTQIFGTLNLLSRGTGGFGDLSGNGNGGIGTGNIARLSLGDGNPNVTIGTLVIDSSGTGGGADFGGNKGGAGQGGTASISSISGIVTINSTSSITANATGGAGGTGVGGDATGGLASVGVVGGNTVHAVGDLTLEASATGGAGVGGGKGTGGTATINAFGGTGNFAGKVTMRSIGQGGAGLGGGSGGAGIGNITIVDLGTAFPAQFTMGSLETDSGGIGGNADGGGLNGGAATGGTTSIGDLGTMIGSLTIAGTADLKASAIGGLGGTGSGGNALGGTAVIGVGEFNSFNFNDDVTLEASALGGDGGALGAGSGTGGTAKLEAFTGTTPILGTLALFANGEGGLGLAGGDGGDGIGGVTKIALGDGTPTVTLGGLLTDSGARGGDANGGGKNGGAGVGGTTSVGRAISVSPAVGPSGSVTVTGTARMVALATGGLAGTGIGGGGAGGTIDIAAVGPVMLHFDGTTTLEAYGTRANAGSVNLASNSTQPGPALRFATLNVDATGPSGADPSFSATMVDDRIVVTNNATINVGGDTNFVSTDNGGFDVGGTFNLTAGGAMNVTHSGTETLSVITANNAKFNVGDFFADDNSPILITNLLEIDSGLSGGAGAIKAKKLKAANVVLKAGKDIVVTEAADPVSAEAESITLSNAGDLNVTHAKATKTVMLTSTTGGVTASDVTAGGGDVTVQGVTAVNVTGASATKSVILTSTTGGVTAANVTAGAGNVTPGDVNATGGTFVTFNGTVGSTNGSVIGLAPVINVNGQVQAPTISLASAKLTFGGAAQLGQAGLTNLLTITNNGTDPSTIGGAGGGAGYVVSATDLNKMRSKQIVLSLPSLGLATPDVTVQSFTLDAPTIFGSGAGGLTIDPPASILVNGAVKITNANPATFLTFEATDSITVLTPTGSIGLFDSTNQPGGILNLSADRIVVASQSAINDLATTTTIQERDDRLAQADNQNDAGALQASAMNFAATHAIYIQNSGTGKALTKRRGFTVGTGGLTITTQNFPMEIVINGRQTKTGTTYYLGDTLVPNVTFVTPNPGVLNFDPLSTINGCVILNAPCSATSGIPLPPIQDVVNLVANNDPPTGDQTGQGPVQSVNLALIQFAGSTPYSFAPPIDEPVTGAGNQDLWTGNQPTPFTGNQQAPVIGNSSCGGQDQAACP